MRTIRNAAATLQLTVNNLKGADQDPETHPKIKSIAKNSLPLFIKAMNSSLAKELPEDPEEFYAAAVESVKGALNTVRGQGRYLMVAFPDEMKATKTGIDAVGREINVMTKSLGRHKETTARIGAVRAAYGALGDATNDIGHSCTGKRNATVPALLNSPAVLTRSPRKPPASRQIRLLPRSMRNGSGVPALPGSATISCGTMPR